MDVREKLVELVNDVLMYLPWGEIQNDTAERIVDRMMDHDVTVQEWISVNDRLPELGERVICTDGYSVFEQYRVEPSCVYGMWDRFGLKSPMQKVTYWMPIPQPPKGE